MLQTSCGLHRSNFFAHNETTLVGMLSSPSSWKLSEKHRIPVRQNTPAICSPTKAILSTSTRGEGSGGGKASYFKVTAIVTVKKKHHLDYKEKILEDLNAFSDSAGQKVLLQLVSTRADPRTNQGKRSGESPLKDWAEKAKHVADKVEYIAEFVIHEEFGVPGAVIIRNEHPNELFLETIALEGLPSGRVYFPCYSWVHSKNDNAEHRVFFSNAAYLPQNTPDGLRDLREYDKSSIRGDGRGTRKFYDRIYDYDVYNDIGNPDQDRVLARPILGNNDEFPYPRHCRTGRPHTKTDQTCESVLGKESSYYVPRDETFEEIKKETFTASSFKVIMHQLIPSLVKNITRVNNHEFTGFSDIDRLYKEGMVLKELALPIEFFNRLWVPKFITLLENSINLQYSQPKLFSSRHLLFVLARCI